MPFKMGPLLLVFVVCVLKTIHCADPSRVWCYHRDHCDEDQWKDIFPRFCNLSRQSPINIVSANATPDANLTAFTFTNFDSKTALDKIKNTGKTVKVTLKSGVKINDGGLGESYDSLQFHLHWGNKSSPGSEHTVDGKQFPMELHIVNVRSIHNLNTTQAVADPNGLAALGFFIEEAPGNNTPNSWKILTDYLTDINATDSYVNVTHAISLNDLLVGVDMTQFYRYHGSLTTPACNEAVVWTVFKDSIKVSKDLLDRFSETVKFSDGEFMTQVFRSVQSELPVSTTVRATTSSALSTTCYSLGLLFLNLLLMYSTVEALHA